MCTPASPEPILGQWAVAISLPRELRKRCWTVELGGRKGQEGPEGWGPHLSSLRSSLHLLRCRRRHPSRGWKGSRQGLPIGSSPERALFPLPLGLMEALPVLLWEHWAGGCMAVAWPFPWAPAAEASTQLIKVSLPSRPRGKEACLNYGCSSKMTTHPHRRNVSTANDVLEGLLRLCSNRNLSPVQRAQPLGVLAMSHTVPSTWGSPSTLSLPLTVDLSVSGPGVGGVPNRPSLRSWLDNGEAPGPWREGW